MPLPLFLSPDPTATAQHLVAVFGWAVSPDGMTLQQDGQTKAVNLSNPQRACVALLDVSDCATKHAQALANGASNIMPPSPCPAGGTHALVCTALGVVYGFWQAPTP